MSKEQAAVVWF